MGIPKKNKNNRKIKKYYMISQKIILYEILKKKYTIAKRRFLGEWYWSQSLSFANWAIICFSLPRDTESPSGTPAILERERENRKDRDKSEEKQEGKSEMKFLLSYYIIRIINLTK